MQKPKAIVCDLDGTLCNCNHRRHHAEKGDYKKFFELMGDDEVNEWCREIIYRFQNDYAVILTTGRLEKYRKVTDLWLTYNEIEYDLLLMRQSTEGKDDVVKRQIYKEYIEPYYDILFVLDDRQMVVDQWRNLGLTCLQPDYGNF